MNETAPTYRSTATALSAEATDDSPQRLLGVLVVEDDESQCMTLCDILDAEGFSARGCGTAEEALRMLEQDSFAVAIVDHNLPGASGTQLLDRIRAIAPTIRVIIHTGYGSFESAKDAVNFGAFAYIEKLHAPEELISTVHRAMEDYMARALAESEGALRESQRMLTMLMSNLPGMAYRCRNDEAFTIEFASEGCTALTGYTPQQFITRELDYIDVIHPDDRHYVRESVQFAVKAGRKFELLYRIRTNEGREKWVWEQGRAVTNEAGRVLALEGFISDITDRRHAEQALAARARQQAVVSELGQQALGGMPLGELMDEAVRQVAQTLDVDLCKVLELLPRGDKLLLTAAVGWPVDAINHLTVPNTRESQAGFTLLMREPVIVEDWQSDPRFGGMAYHNYNAISGVSVVIEGGDKPYGVLSAHTRQKRQFTKDDLNFVQSVANVLADAVQQTRTAGALRESEMHYRQAAESNRRLLHEVNHRVRNNLGGLVSLVSLTRQRAKSVEEFAQAIESRINAMSRTHNLLADSGWKPLELTTLINHLLNSASDVAPNAIEVHIEGPTTPISPRQSVPLAMSIIELFTNSCKHGAHRSPSGKLEITWSHSRRQERSWVSLHWRERGGPAIDKLVCPSLGTELVQGFVNFELGGRCDLKFPPQGADHRLEFIIEDAAELRSPL